MCGIVAGVTSGNIGPILIDGLERLEYRGYDSAGIAMIDGGIKRIRTVGRVVTLSKLVGDIRSTTGIGHTRWATHGRPSEHNAHPHSSIGRGVEISVVHNGIIENHGQLKELLVSLGYVFSSDTDTETIAHLIHNELMSGTNLLGSVRRLFGRLSGSFSIAAISSSEPNVVVGARQGSPLVIGIGRELREVADTFLSSDLAALAPYVDEYYHMSDGEITEIRNGHVCVVDAQGSEVTPCFVATDVTPLVTSRGTFRSFMEKEIFEQPDAVERTLGSLIGETSIPEGLFGKDDQEILSRTRHVLILACGSSYYAGLLAKYWIESIARRPVSVEIASEFRYRHPPIVEDTLIVCISQSGETADTLGALQAAQAMGIGDSLSICNVSHSSLCRLARLHFSTNAGPEIGVASTKAYLTQLVAIAILAVALGKNGGTLSDEEQVRLISGLRALPGLIRQALDCQPAIRAWAKQIHSRNSALFIGRGVQFPLALEGALKLKEISYIHAEAFAAGELKHGPLALVEEGLPIVALASNDRYLEKMISNLQEIRARNGNLFVISIGDAAFPHLDLVNLINLKAPSVEAFSPILSAIPLQLLALHTATFRGRDVDKPRNLAKSVTVE